mgnify:CR=1 FL=1
MHLIYIIPFLLSLGFVPVQFHLYKKHISVYYIALLFSILVCNFGLLLLSYTTDVHSATIAYIVNYFGCIYTPIFAFLCVADLTKVKVSFSFKSFCYLFSAFILLLVITIPYFPIYYKSIGIDYWHGVTYVIRDYGPLHILYPIYLFFLTGSAFFLVIKSFKNRKQVSALTSFSLFAVLILSLAVYVIERLCHFKLELSQIAMIIEQMCILFLLNHIKIYDISGITCDTMMEDSRYGFISFLSGEVFIASEGQVSKWFPEVDMLTVDHPIPEYAKNDSDFLQQISAWMKGEDKELISYFERDGKIFETKYSVLPNMGRKKIHLITLRDDTQQQRLTRIIKDYNENLELMVNQKTEKIRKIQDDIILAMASTVEIGDDNTGGHIKRTSDVMRIFVGELKKTGRFPELTERLAECVIKAAPLHDYGKVCVPDVVLNKPGKYTDEEYEIMKTHSEKGAVIVRQILQNSDDDKFKDIAINVAHYHHEKWNGKGYPTGLQGKEIPFEARIMALADVFDALVSRRVYKEQFSYDTAFKIIEDSCGDHFDPELCPEFLKCRPLLEELYNSY